MGTHELWHSVSDEENWLPPLEVDPKQFAEIELIRRAGILTGRAGKLRRKDSTSASALSLLSEGSTQYLTRESLKLVGKKLETTTYKDELEVVDLLIQAIGGDDPFFQAMLTKRGFRSLFLILEKTFGKFALYNEVEELYSAMEFPYTLETYKSMVKKWGRYTVLRNYQDLDNKYPEKSALRHITDLIYEDSTSRGGARMLGEKVPRYEETLKFIEEVGKVNTKKGKKRFIFF